MESVGHRYDHALEPPDDTILDELKCRVAARDPAAFARMWQLMAGEIAESIQLDVPGCADVMTLTAATFVEMWWMAPCHTSSATSVRAWLHNIADARALEHCRTQTAATPTGRMWTSAANAETTEIEIGALLAAGLSTDR